MVERHLAKVDVAGSSPVFRSIMCGYRISVILQPSKLARWVRFPLPAPIKILSNEFEKNLDKYLLRYYNRIRSGGSKVDKNQNMFYNY